MSVLHNMVNIICMRHKSNDWNLLISSILFLWSWCNRSNSSIFPLHVVHQMLTAVGHILHGTLAYYGSVMNLVHTAPQCPSRCTKCDNRAMCAQCTWRSVRRPTVWWVYWTNNSHKVLKCRYKLTEKLIQQYSVKSPLSSSLSASSTAAAELLFAWPERTKRKIFGYDIERGNAARG